MFPGVALKTAFELFYSRVGQHTSVGNYWNDPHHQGLYYNYSEFLPYVNNEILSSRSADFKYGLVKLNKLVLIGGPDDNVITPWQSRFYCKLFVCSLIYVFVYFSQFGYYDANETVINLMKREIYTEDLIGLKTLNKQKKLHVISVPGVNHFMWHQNKSIVDNYILPFLD